MTVLADVLATEAVPSGIDPDELARFGDELLARAQSSHALDAPDDPALTECARRVAPEFLALAEAASRADAAYANALADAAVAALPALTPPLLFLDAADVAVSSPLVIGPRARALTGQLRARFDALKATGAGLAAYDVIETMTRVALAHPACKHAVLDTLTAVTLNDPPELLERLPRLVGVALDAWGEPELRGLLESLLEVDAARADALVELGLTELRDGLDSAGLTEIMTALDRARTRFAQAEASEEAREDATVYRCVLDVVIGFGTPDSGSGDSALGQLEAAARRRQLWSQRSGLRDWAAPRRQAETEWRTLATALRRAAEPLARPSWKDPATTLPQVLAAYRASRSLTLVDGDGLRHVIEPVVEAAFVNRAGLLAHLRDLLEDEPALDAADAEDARQLLDMLEIDVGDRDSGGDDADVGKALAAAPELTLALGAAADPQHAAVIAQLADSHPETLAAFNAYARDTQLERRTSRDPLVDQMLERTEQALAGCPDFSGDTRAEFVDLLTVLFRFLATRADIGTQSGGETVTYLAALGSGDKPHLEAELQRDAGQFLKGSHLRPDVRFEERDIAAGRADLTVKPDLHRFSVEIKRELTDASRQAIRANYAAQAVAYTAASPRLAVLLVLDLTDHSHGVPGVLDSLWVEDVEVAEADPRHLVVGVVRGNRPAPSAMTLSK